MDLIFGNYQRAAWPWQLVGIEKAKLGIQDGLCHCYFI
jgi:hypothetical protein